MRKIEINLPLDEKSMKTLKAGDWLLISGTVYTARDEAHKRLMELIKNRRGLPFELKGSTIYYTGPTPARPGQVVGSIGPTTSSRMDVFTPTLLKLGLKAMIGKGKRSEEVVNAIKKYRAIYFAAVGGAGAYLSQKVTDCKLVAFADLGPEAVYRLQLKDFPAIVVTK